MDALPGKRLASTHPPLLPDTRRKRSNKFVPDSPLEESGFEPLVPLTLNQANAGEREEKIAMSPLRRIG
jgi:hypothetical protein